MPQEAEATLYPPVEPYDHGMLDVGDGNLVFWEACGNPHGKPALVVHGGPGSGCRPGTRQWFDPERYRVVLFDQRNCGRSTPHASDPAADMAHNTTDDLIADMERLRVHLGVESWLLYGYSWGSTLILAYAERHPERVSEIVIASVTMTRRSDIDWLYRGVGANFPEQWARFRDAVPDRVRERVGGDLTEPLALPAAYALLMESPDAAVREQAARDWCAWEDAVLSEEPNGSAHPYGDRPAADRLALVRICAHYFSHGAWLEEGALLRDAGRLAGIPAVLVHGRYDLGTRPEVPTGLAAAWPDARLVIVEDAGHKGSATERREVLAALDGFAK